MPESHLPECPFGGDTDYSWLDECICDNLRACAARVREVYESSDDYMLGIAVGMHDGWLEGHTAALDAARDVLGNTRFMNVADGQIAMDAITALMEDTP